MPVQPPYLDFVDFDGKTYTYSYHNYEKHSHHKELEIENFKDRIQRAICEPDFIYPSFNKKNRFCYYYQEYSSEGHTRYTKVVVEVGKEKRYSIITAFRPDKIQEKKYFDTPLSDRP